VVEYVGVLFAIIDTFPREDGSGLAIGSGVVVATDSAIVVATDSAIVVATDSAIVVAMGTYE